MKTIKILLIPARFHPHKGGVETVVENLAVYLKDLGHDVLIITNKYPRRLPSTECVRGIEVKREYFLGYGPELYAGKSIFLIFVVNVIRFFTDLKLFLWFLIFAPSVVNCHYLGDVCDQVQRNIYFRIFKTPIITSLHGGDVDGEPYLSNFNKKRFVNILSKSSGITCCSDFLARQAMELSGSTMNQVKVIHNGIAMKDIQVLDSHRFDKPTVLAVGQLVPHKGMDRLIQAFNTLPAHINADLRIIGDGIEYLHLSELVRVSVVKENIKLEGSKNNIDVIRWMKGSVCVVVPSLREPFGLVVLEAMAAGCQVIATNVGGIPEFLKTPPNILIDTSVDALVEALIKVLTIEVAEVEKIRMENIDYAKKFDWSFVVEDYIQLYQKVLKA